MSTATIIPTIVAEPLTPEWHAARSTGIGGSEAAAAAGLSEYRTPLDIYLRKRGELPDEEDNAAMRLGRALEPVIAAEFVRATGRAVARAPIDMYRHGEHRWMLGTPDAILDNGELGEWKSTSWRMAKRLGEQDTADLPSEWLCQAHWYCEVLDRSACNFGVLIDGRTLKTYRVERNQRLIDLLISAGLELWERIEGGDPPEPTWTHSRTPQLIREMFGTVNETKIMLSERAGKLWAMHEKAKRLERKCELRAAYYKSEVAFEIGKNFAGVLPGGDRMVRRKTVTRKAHEVKETSYISIRSVKDDGRLALPAVPEKQLAAQKNAME